MDPLEFRKRNPQARPDEVYRRPGGCGPFPELCDTIKPHYDRALRDAAAHNNGGLSNDESDRCGAFGGGPADIATAVELTQTTPSTPRAPTREGNDSMLTQLAADTLNIPR